ncbi:GIY-YIG nuclease family protein [Lewinella sp. W8]|uniref:GIY-YIG nuclease family protein n=1 Tax=Lewinella sp. W8 TaxID=2528208 RepID=UPI001068A313|nr:GIY-YIG nuclease family protein [Lewinella sp. W8]MTB53005.1 hypothetical protein [Lewinella sp. W8]
MFDYREVYQLHARFSSRGRSRRKSLMVKKRIALKVPFAEAFEKRLHKKYDEYRIWDIRKAPSPGLFKNIYKIGISSDTDRRVEEINDDPKSGRTEYFLLYPSQAASIRIQIRTYWLAFWLLQIGILCAVSLYVLSLPPLTVDFHFILFIVQDGSAQSRPFYKSVFGRHH